MIEYIPNFIPKETADECFKYLQEDIPWVRRDSTPRMEAFYSTIGKPYTYGSGGFERTYEPEKEFDPVVAQIIRAYRSDLELCFLNRYLNQSDHLGWHSDDSPEIDTCRPIAVVSFGVEREIWFREIPKPWSGKCIACNGTGYYDNDGSPPCGACNGTGKGEQPEVKKQLLEHGSLLIMPPGFQQTHQHRIPKSSFMCGERISLTYRGAKYGQN